MTEPMRAKDVLDIRSDMQNKLLRRDFRDLMAGTILAGTDRSVRLKEALDTVDATLVSVERAENFFVSADMCELIEHSAKMFDESDKADTTLPPVNYGFAYFERPFVLTDIQGSTIKINAMLWNRTIVRLNNSPVEGFICHMWNDQYRTPDDIASKTAEELSEMLDREVTDEMVEEYARATGRWGYVGMITYLEGQDVGPLEIEVSEDTAEEYAKSGVFTLVSYTNVTRIFHAFWLMMQQPLTEAVKDYADRATRKRMMAANLPSEVTIIQFRRRERREFEGPSKKIEWSHRWMVRGFWRWQWYKDENKVPFQRRIWIHPTIKGPEDKPLVIKQKVNAFVR